MTISYILYYIAERPDVPQRQDEEIPFVSGNPGGLFLTSLTVFLNTLLFIKVYSFQRKTFQLLHWLILVLLYPLPIHERKSGEDIGYIVDLFLHGEINNISHMSSCLAHTFFFCFDIDIYLIWNMGLSL